MKNSNLFPFERNKYFYGKLLSVDDFELEQRYMNDKRRMLNRFIFGSGVAAGLYVVRVDEQTISVEAGIALDSWGREIVVDVPVVKKLSLLDGFKDSSTEDARYVYLCLEYDEEETDRVHNIAGTTHAAKEHGDISYNKIKEGYHLFLTDREPEGDIISPADWYQTSQIVYQEGDIKITQSMPRYIQAGSETLIKIQVENMGRDTLSFSYELLLGSLLSEGRTKIAVSFNEVLFERTGSYEMTYPLLALDNILEEGTAALDADSVLLSLSGVRQDVHMEGKMSAVIVDGDEKEAVQKEYYRTSMTRLQGTGYRLPVYLAKIYFVNAVDTYIIERIENVPFSQYVSNHIVESALYRMIQEKQYSLASKKLSGAVDIGKAGFLDDREAVRAAQGTADILMPEGGQRGDKFFSQEIIHGLGLGKVTIVTGLEKDSGAVVYGASEIFEALEEKGADAETASCVNEKNGSFVIGVRLLTGRAAGTIRVHWTAFKDREEIVLEKNEKRIFIKPNLLELSVRQSKRLEAVCENMVERAVSWSVKDGGGFIDENGMYTAPNTAGVYEVVAQSVAFPEIRASVFVVVRDSAKS